MQHKDVITMSVIVTSIVSFMGGIDTAMKMLLLCMVTDYITGFSCALLNKSGKTADGKLSSKAGFIGLLKKGIMLLVITISYQLGAMLTIPEFRTVVIFCFLSNELLSITENLKVLGIPLPKVFTDVMAKIAKKGE